MPPYTRRSLLVSSGGLAAAAIGLAGCQSGGGSDAAPPPADPATVPLADVPVGGGTIMQDGAYVVTQPNEGEVKAFTKICTHQECPVARIDGSDIVCDCHGSRFSITDGSVTNGPAEEPLKSFPATVDGDTVTINS